MKRRAPVLLTVLFTLTLAPTILIAQTRLFFGAGATMPNGDYGEYANTGWLTNVGLGFGLGSNPRLGANVSFWYGSNSHSDIDGDKTNLYGGFGHLRYSFHDQGKAGLFAAGGLGYLVHSYSSDQFDGESEGAFAYSLAAGFDIPLNNLGLYILAGWVGGEDTFLRLMAGLSIPLGGN
jgi:hypothetical protein